MAQVWIKSGGKTAPKELVAFQDGAWVNGFSGSTWGDASGFRGSGWGAIGSNIGVEATGAGRYVSGESNEGSANGYLTYVNNSEYQDLSKYYSKVRVKVQTTIWTNSTSSSDTSAGGQLFINGGSIHSASFYQGSTTSYSWTDTYTLNTTSLQLRAYGWSSGYTSSATNGRASITLLEVVFLK